LPSDRHLMKRSQSRGETRVRQQRQSPEKQPFSSHNSALPRQPVLNRKMHRSQTRFANPSAKTQQLILAYYGHVSHKSGQKLMTTIPLMRPDPRKSRNDNAPRNEGAAHRLSASWPKATTHKAPCAAQEGLTETQVGEIPRLTAPPAPFATYRVPFWRLWGSAFAIRATG
jgi:hypothetical protein